MSKRNPSVSDQPAPDPTVKDLLDQGDIAAATELARLAAGADRRTAKDARAALYRLKLRGIEPAELAVVQVAAMAQAPSVAQRAVLTSVTPSGAQLLMFLRDDPHGGSPTLITYFCRGTEGLLDVTGKKMGRRELDDELTSLRTADQNVVGYIDVDYARHLLQRAVATTRAAGRPIPSGFSRWTEMVGEPNNEYARPAIYDLIDADALALDVSIPGDAAKLFEREYFTLWILDERQAAPWAVKLVESQRTTIVLDEPTLHRRAEAVIDEAADALFSPESVAEYRRRLEDAALVLHADGRVEEAREALAHAVKLVPDSPPHKMPFLRVLADRTISIVLAIYAKKMEEMEAEKAKSPIHRV